MQGKHGAEPIFTPPLDHFPFKKGSQMLVIKSLSSGSETRAKRMACSHTDIDPNHSVAKELSFLSFSFFICTLETIETKP